MIGTLTHEPELTRTQYDLRMRTEVERLLREGEMPPLDEVLAAIKHARKEYRQRIADARKRTR